MEMTVYAYEYSILMRLKNIYNIKNINIDKEKVYAYGWKHSSSGELVNKTLFSFDGNSSIIFNFNNNFHIRISRDIISNAFQNRIPLDETIEMISSIINNELEK